MIFGEIRGHLVVLQFYRAQTRDSDGPLRKRAIQFEIEVLDTLNFQRPCLICSAPNFPFSQIELGVCKFTPLGIRLRYTFTYL